MGRDRGLWAILEATGFTIKEVALLIGREVETVRKWQSTGVSKLGRTCMVEKMGLAEEDLDRPCSDERARAYAQDWRERLSVMDRVQEEFGARKGRPEVILRIIEQSGAGAASAAAALGISVTTIGNWQAGRQAVSLALLIALSNVLEVSILELDGEASDQCVARAASRLARLAEEAREPGPVAVRPECKPLGLLAVLEGQDFADGIMCKVLGVRRDRLQFWRAGGSIALANLKSVRESLGMEAREVIDRPGPVRLRALRGCFREKALRAKSWEAKASWTVRTCLDCGQRYQVGSASVCWDCIMGIGAEL